MDFAFGITSGLVLAMNLLPSAGDAPDEVVDAPSAQASAAAGEALLIDIRRPEEWYQTGMPVDAIGITWGEPDFVERVRASIGDDLTRPLVLICRTGNRSAHALRLLRSEGFRAVTHVGEGMIGSGHGPGWLARALPTKPVR